MNIRDLLYQDEGFRLRVYDDATGKSIGPGSVVVGHPTIGIGRALDTKGVSRREAEMLLDADIEEATADAVAVLRCFGSLNKARQMAVTVMAFQMGRSGLAKFHRMLAAIEAQDWRRAYDEALDSVWARTQTPARAMRVATMLFTGTFPAAPAGSGDKEIIHG